MKDALLVLSGGMDSVTLLYDRAADIALAVSFDYGSKFLLRACIAKSSKSRTLRFRSSSCTITLRRHSFRGQMLSLKARTPTKT